MSVKTVVIVNDFAHVEGGASQVAITSALALCQVGIDVIFFSGVGPVDHRLAQSKAKVVCLDRKDIASEKNRLRAFLSGLWNFESGKKFKRVLAPYNQHETVVHVHGWTKSLSSSVTRVAERQGFKTVFTLHDYFVACPNGGFFEFPKNRVCERRALSPSCVMTNCDSRSYIHKLWRVVRQVVQKWCGCIPSGKQGFIFISRFSEVKLTPYLTGTPAVFHIQNPIFTSEAMVFKPRARGCFLFLGRVSREKGWRLFGEAMKQTNSVGVVIGEGQDLAVMKKSYPELMYKGWLDREFIFDELENVCCLVFTSLLFETLGLTVLEAASAGVPSIVPSNSAAAESVVDGETGLLYTQGDIEDLERKINLIKDEPNLGNRLGKNAFERFWRNPPLPARHAQELVRTYNSMLAERL